MRGEKLADGGEFAGPRDPGQIAAHGSPRTTTLNALIVRDAHGLWQRIDRGAETCLELLTLVPTAVDPPASKYNERWEEQT
jgi:hypothetical protein